MSRETMSRALEWAVGYHKELADRVAETLLAEQCEPFHGRGAMFVHFFAKKSMKFINIFNRKVKRIILIIAKMFARIVRVETKWRQHETIFA